MSITKPILKNISVIIGLAIGGYLAVTLVTLAASWVGPTAAPPGNNTSEPINVSSASQVKIGGLWVGSLGVSGQIIIQGGSPGSGKFLSSDGSGLASWKYSKICILFDGTTSGSIVHVPTDWSGENCRNLLNNFGGSEYQLGCLGGIGTQGASFGSRGKFNGEYRASMPNPNFCGWKDYN